MMKYISILLFYLMEFQHLVNCQIPFPGSCPEVKIVERFDLDKYMGTWYEYSKYPFIFELGQKCQQAVYKNEGNDTISVVNTGVYVIINKPNSAVGIAKVIAPGQLAVAFRNQSPDTPNYLILGTDYDNWVVVYSCRNITSFSHARILWILTRERQPTTEVVNAAKQIIKENKLSETFLIKSTQTECPDINDSTDDDQVPETDASTTVGDQPSIDFATSTERVIETA